MTSRAMYVRKVLKLLKKERLGECSDRPVTPEVASSSLVGPARKIKGLREQRSPNFFGQTGARSPFIRYKYSSLSLRLRCWIKR